MADEQLPARFSLPRQLFFCGQESTSKTATNHTQNVVCDFKNSNKKIDE